MNGKKTENFKNRTLRDRLLACLCAGLLCLSPCTVLAAEPSGQEELTIQSETQAEAAESTAAEMRSGTVADETAETLETADEAAADAASTAEPADASSSVQPVEADSLDEYIALTEPDLDRASFDVNMENGRITGTDEELEFDETFDASLDSVQGSRKKMRRAIDDTEGYQVSGESGRKIHVLSDYSLGRIMVAADLEDSFGASSAVTYDGETLLTYDSEEETREGYERLIQAYGEDRVTLDTIISLDDSADTGETDTADVMYAAADGGQETPGMPQEAEDQTFYGWGTKAMYLDVQMQKFADSDQDITIAVLDSGINENHEIFRDTVILDESRNILDPNASYADDHGHGTMVSSVLAESTSPNVSLLVLKVMNKKGEASWFNVKQAMDYAADQGVDIINMSFGMYYSQEACDSADSFMAEIAGQGILICASSGNQSRDMSGSDGKRFYPAASPYTISVGAIQPSGERAAFSNYGSQLDFVAPGAGLTLADYTTNDGYRTVQGTSFSCPYVCASAAFLLMADEDNTPDTVHGQLIQIADDLGEEGKDVYYGNGMPDFSNDVSLTPIEITGKPTVTVNTKKFAYDGKNKRPTVTVSYEGRILTSYELSYPGENPEIGVHKVTVTLVGNYADTVSVTKSFQIVPKTVSLEKVTLYQSGNKAKFKWTKSQGSYQIMLSTNKNFKGGKKYNASDTSRTISGLKSGKTYYVKVRAVKKVSGKKIWGLWSKTYKFSNSF